MVKSLPEGYEIRLVQPGHDSDGRFGRIVPFFNGKPLAEGDYASLGYRFAIWKARRIIRLHRRYGVK